MRMEGQTGILKGTLTGMIEKRTRMVRLTVTEMEFDVVLVGLTGRNSL